MTKKKKMLLSFTAVIAAASLIAAGVFAYFIDYDWTNDDGKVGTVAVDLSPINVSHTPVYERVGGVNTSTPINASKYNSGIKTNLTTKKIATWSYFNALTDPNDDPSEYWLYNNSDGLKVNDLFFRTNYKGVNDYASQALADKDSVAYCVDPGLIATDSHFTEFDGVNVGTNKDLTGKRRPASDYTDLQEAEKVSDDVKKVLKVGFPNRNYSEYRHANNDAELEWATSVAIYIAEGAAYKTVNVTKQTGSGGVWRNTANDSSNKKEWVNGEFRLDKMNLDERIEDALMIPSSFFVGFDDETAKEESFNKSKRLKQLVADILEEADRVTSIPDFTLDETSSIVTPLNTEGKEYEYKKNEILGGYLVGPFYLNNTIGTAKFTIKDSKGKAVSQTVNGVHLVASPNSSYNNVQIDAGDRIGVFEDPNKVMDKIGKVEYNSPFYLYVPLANKYETYSIHAEIDGDQYLSYPMYYYWSGNNAEQRMISCQKVKPQAEISISNAVYDEYKYWNPGDVLTLKWNVTNKGTKSVVTRNIVSIYWEENNMNRYANQNDIVYLYPENNDSTDIYYDQFGKFPEAYRTSCMSGCSYRELGSMAPVYVNGKKYTSGYSLVIYGDALDGVGEGAEIGDAKEQNYVSHFDETLNDRDVVSLKMCLSSRANIHTMNKKLVVRVETQAMQYRNTSNEDWDALFRDSYDPTLTTGAKDPNDKGNALPWKWERYDASDTNAKWEKRNDGTPKWDSQWQTVGTQEYVIGTGATTPNEPNK